MNRDEICKSLYYLRKVYDIDTQHQRKMQIVYGAAMVLRGVKQSCDDIDIGCLDQNTFDYIQDVVGIRAVPYKGNDSCLYIPITDDIDVFGPVSNMMEPPVCTLISDSDDVDTCSLWMVQTNVSLLVEKIKRNREKDQHDIVLLRNHLESRERMVIHRM